VQPPPRLLGYPLILQIIINAYWEPLEFEIPVLGEIQGSWRRCVDTYLDPPDDICSWADAPELQGSTYRAQPRSVVFLVAKAEEE
jgi:isoamylase